MIAHVIMFVCGNSCLTGSKTSTDDIHKTLGMSSRSVDTCQHLTLSASAHARDGNESQQERTFVA